MSMHSKLGMALHTHHRMFMKKSGPESDFHHNIYQQFKFLSERLDANDLTAKQVRLEAELIEKCVYYAIMRKDWFDYQDLAFKRYTTDKSGKK